MLSNKKTLKVLAIVFKSQQVTKRIDTIGTKKWTPWYEYSNYNQHPSTKLVKYPLSFSNPNIEICWYPKVSFVIKLFFKILKWIFMKIWIKVLKTIILKLQITIWIISLLTWQYHNRSWMEKNQIYKKQINFFKK